MKASTLTVILKGIAYVGTGVCISLGTNLSQWANTNEWPNNINWVVIIVGACGAGFTQLLSFMSGSYNNWMRNGTQQQNGGKQ